MTLNLDLASAKAKVARASELLDVLERDLPIHLSQNGPYAVRFSLDQNTGWCEVWLVPSNRGDYRFSLLFGDFIHNLRCALDYIVTALVIASGAQLTTKHQFPIYRQEASYIKDVGPFGSPNPKGLLGNVTHGVGLIESWQPYKLQQQGVDPRDDPLWHVHRFANADKHREIAAFLPVPVGAIDVAYNGIKVKDDPVLTFPPNWSPDQEYIIHRMRFDPPDAYNLRATGRLTINAGFSTAPFGAEPLHAVAINKIRATCDHVAMLVNLFETI